MRSLQASIVVAVRLFAVGTSSAAATYGRGRLGVELPLARPVVVPNGTTGSSVGSVGGGGVGAVPLRGDDDDAWTTSGRVEGTGALGAGDISSGRPEGARILSHGVGSGGGGDVGAGGGCCHVSARGRDGPSGRCHVASIQGRERGSRRVEGG